jgi:uncharacterized protein YneF (UPF0154 family)
MNETFKVVLTVIVGVLAGVFIGGYYDSKQ